MTCSNVFDKSESVSTQYDGSVRSLGSGRIKLIDIIEKMVRLYSKRVYNALIKSKLIARSIVKFMCFLFEIYPGIL